MSVHILVVDCARRSLADLESCLGDGDWSWSGPVDEAHQALEALLHGNPDLILLDPEIPGFEGGDFVRRILEVRPAARVLAMGGMPDPDLLRDMFRAGARGFCLREELDKELPAALPAVAGDRYYISTAVAESLVEMAVQASRIRPSGLLNCLTEREHEVLGLLMTGLSTKQAAARLDLAPKTVDTHRKNIMDKLEVDNMVSLVKLTIREGFTSL